MDFVHGLLSPESETHPWKSESSVVEKVEARKLTGPSGPSPDSSDSEDRAPL